MRQTDTLINYPVITYVQSEQMHNFPSPLLKFPKKQICLVSVEVNYSAFLWVRRNYCHSKLMVCCKREIFPMQDTKETEGTEV
jgi:hypothetical protein